MKNWFGRFSRKAWLFVGAAIVIALIAIYISGGGEEQSAFQTAPVKRGDLMATVGATGSVRAQQSAALVWETSGIVAEVNVKIGQRVKKGDVLARLDKSALNQSILLAEADLANAQKALEDLLNSDTARAQALRALDTAEADYQKAYDYRKSLNGKITITETFWRFGKLQVRTYKGYADKETIADADEKLALAEAKLNDARRNVERLKNGADPAEVAAAQARIDAAKATLRLAYIEAPFDGVITQANVRAGDKVSVGGIAFRIDDLSRLLVDVQVSEVDINNVAAGQDAMLTFDAILNKEYHGKVIEVGQAGDTLQGVVSFTVTVELTDADEMVKPGMTSAVNIVVNEQKDVALIPNRAVRLIDGDRVVYVLKNGAPVSVKIQLGATDGNNSVLTGGDLKEGDEIILNPPNMSGPFGG